MKQYLCDCRCGGEPNAFCVLLIVLDHKSLVKCQRLRGCSPTEDAFVSTDVRLQERFGIHNAIVKSSTASVISNVFCFRNPLLVLNISIASVIPQVV